MNVNERCSRWLGVSIFHRVRVRIDFANYDLGRLKVYNVAEVAANSQP